MRSPLTMSLVGKEEQQAIVAVVNQGIDSRLEGFTRSKFVWVYRTTKTEEIAVEDYVANRDGSRLALALSCAIDSEEETTFMRRLCEYMEDQEDDLAYDEASSLIDAILLVHYLIDEEALR